MKKKKPNRFFYISTNQRYAVTIEKKYHFRKIAIIPSFLHDSI